MMDAMKNREATPIEPGIRTPEAPAERSSRLSPQAERALAEAEARREAEARQSRERPEIDGRGGLDPVRYGDWEIKGLTSDF